MKTYTVEYREHRFGPLKTITVDACNAVAAYDKAVYDVIPEVLGTAPYSAWVSGVKLVNGKIKSFNTCEGLPY